MMTQPEQLPLRLEHLIGTWSLIACEGRSSTGEVLYLYGQEPVGMLMYDAKGYMSVMLMRPGRSPFASGDPLGGTPEEIRTAFEGFNAYCGRYTVNTSQGSVTHHLIASNFPNWEGTEQTRYATLSEDRLELSAPPILARGVEWFFSLKWKRAS